MTLVVGREGKRAPAQTRIGALDVRVRRRVDGLAVALLVPELGLSVRVGNVTRNVDAWTVLSPCSHQSTEVLLELGSVRSGKVKLGSKNEVFNTTLMLPLDIFRIHELINRQNVAFLLGIFHSLPFFLKIFNNWFCLTLK